MLRQKLQNAATTGNGVEKQFKGQPTELKIYIVGSAGVGAGAVQLEEAHEAGYAGTWSAIGSPVTVTADAVKTVAHTAVVRALRARISTTVTGGTVTVYLVAAQDKPA